MSQLLVTAKNNWKLLLILIIVIVLVVALLSPWKIRGLKSAANPVKSYEEAVQRIEALPTAGLNPLCAPIFMTHGQKTERAAVFVHGFTNCAQQFNELGKLFYDQGYNVLIVSMPYHGLADRMTEEIAQFKTEDMTSYADEIIDIVQGLGDETYMVGISGGGALTAWAAHNRADLDHAVMIAPGFGAQQIPAPLTPAVINVFTLMPDGYDWWNPAEGENLPPEYAYPRYSKHALVQVFRLGQVVALLAREQAPIAKEMLLIVNDNDQSVSGDLITQIVADWEKHNAPLTTYHFDVSLGLPHDLIDPNDLNQQIDLVYPILIEQINK
jgi:carboxylesterase